MFPIFREGPTLEKALSVSAEVGLYAVIVDAIDEKAKGFYLKYCFIAFADALAAETRASATQRNGQPSKRKPSLTHSNMQN